MRIYFNAGRFQSGDAQERFGVRLAADDGSADDFVHKFYLSNRNIHPNLAAVGEVIDALGLRRESDCFKVLTGNEAVDRASIHQERSLPEPVRFSRVRYLHVHAGYAQFVRP